MSPEAVERGSAWFARRGSGALLLARFVPGSRLPTYVAAGVLRYPAGAFSLWLLGAAAVWTPLLVGLAAALGAAAGDVLQRYDRYALLGRRSGSSSPSAWSLTCFCRSSPGAAGACCSAAGGG